MNRDFFFLRFYDEGFKEGHKDGKNKGFQEGRQLGLLKGCEVGREVCIHPLVCYQLTCASMVLNINRTLEEIVDMLGTGYEKYWLILGVKTYHLHE